MFFTFPPTVSNAFGMLDITVLATFLHNLLLKAFLPNLTTFLNTDPNPLPVWFLNLKSLLARAALSLYGVNLLLLLLLLPLGAALSLYGLIKLTL